ncbi:hypothetical protein BH09ACT6_BH09ACT6_09680 [soil metagenome]
MSTDAPTTSLPAEARGFAFYVGIDEFRALADGTTLTEMAAEVKALVRRLAPSAQMYTSIAVAPRDSGGRDLDVVKGAAGRLDGQSAPPDNVGTGQTIIIDLSRRRMLIGSEFKNLTYMEFELLQYLVEHEGSAVTRDELVEVLWSSPESAQMSSRTIDVHVRRLRVKLGSEADLVRTVHGVGYVFNADANVHVRRRKQGH